MSSDFGEKIKISIFGESHSPAVGVVIDGINAGEKIDMDELGKFLTRRAPGRSEFSTGRQEADKTEILSGIVDGVTTGTPISAIIRNQDGNPKDYEDIRNTPRPSHADYAAYVKYGKSHDFRGGGHFSGRLTAPLCIAGGICKQILARKGITIGAHIASVADIEDDRFDSVRVNEQEILGIANKGFPVINEKSGDTIKKEILDAKAAGDSVGGTVECCILGMPAGIGEPMFDGIENSIAKIIFGIPAVKGIEFGAGFGSSRMRGSENNDPIYVDSDVTATESSSMSSRNNATIHADTAYTDANTDAVGNGYDSPHNNEITYSSHPENQNTESVVIPDKIAGTQRNDDINFVKTRTNNSGGITGGLTNGMPIIFTAAFKPTPSIALEQETVDLSTGENTTIKINGRHDPCIVPRAVPCVEAAVAVAILDLISRA